MKDFRQYFSCTIVNVQPPPAVMRRAAATKEKAVSRIVLCGGGGLSLFGTNIWGGWAQNKVAEKQKDYNCIYLDDFSALDKVAEQDGQSDDRHAG